MATTDVLDIVLRVNGASGYASQIGQATRATGNLEATSSKLISTLTKLVSVGAIVKFGKQCIDAASDLQEVANVTDVTFGKNASIINDWAKNQAANFGLSETAAKRYIGTYGTMAKQFGFTKEAAASMGVELVKLTGDVASFYNLDDQSSATKLKSVFTGETESLKELGVVMTEANLNAYALEKGFSKQVKQMNEHEKVALRYSFVMDKLSHAQGDFARTSDGWANSVRTLKLNFENLKIEIGSQLLPVAGQGIAAVSSGLQAVSPVLISVATTVRMYGEAWKSASDQTKELVKSSLTIFGVIAIAPRILSVVQMGVRMLTIEIVGLGSALQATLGIVGIALGAIAFKQLTDRVQELKKSSENAKSVSEIGNVAEETASAVDTLTDSVKDLNDSTNDIDTFLASFDEVNKIGGGNSLMSNLVTADDLLNILGAADGLDNLKGKVGELNGTLGGVKIPDISSGTFLDPEWWKGKWETSKKTVTGFLHTFYTGEWKSNWETGAEEIVAALRRRFPRITRFFENVGETAYNVTNGIRTFCTPIIDSFVESWKIGIDDIITKFNELWQKFEDSKWSNFWEGVGSDIYDKTHPVKRYATGGYPNKGSLFIAGESGTELVGNFGSSQTKVINQSQTINNASPQPVMFSPTIQIDGRKITSVVLENINTMTRSSGKSPLIELGG